MSKPIVMSPQQWDSLLATIKNREKRSVWLSRSKMKEVLGFTVRNHNEWVKEERPQEEISWWNEDEGWYKGKRHDHTVRLDFYDEQKRTMFLLKYGNGQN